MISPYSQQVYTIRKKIQELEKSLYCNIEVNTVDGFQGREKEIIVFSTVRSENEGKQTIG